MPSSSELNPGDDLLSAQYNALRTDVLDTASGHDHSGAAGHGKKVHHGDTTGLGDDDHPQYPELAQAETISGAWTFTGTLRIPCGTEFPGAPVDGSIFYRTDEDKLYVYDGASWEGIPLPSHPILSATHGDTLADAVVDGDVLIGNVTPKWSRLAIAIPAPDVRNVLGIDNGELRPSWKTALDATDPANIANAASPGTSLVFAHRDHVHAHPGGLTDNLHHNPVTAGTLISLATQQVSLAVGSAQWQVPLTGANPFTPVWTAASADVSGGAEAILKSNATGDLALRCLGMTGTLVETWTESNSPGSTRMQDFNFTVAGNPTNAYMMDVDVTITGTPSTVRALDFYLSTQHASGTIDNVQGIFVFPYINGAGAVTTVKNYSTWGYINAGDVSEWIMYDVTNPVDIGAGTLSTLYGLKIDNLTTGATNWSVYTGTAPSYFNAAVTVTGGFNVGTATGATAGNIEASGTLIALNTAAGNVFGAPAGFGVVAVHGNAADKAGIIELVATDLTADNPAGEIVFGNLDGGAAVVAQARIRAYRDGADDAMALAFYTEATGAAVSTKMSLSGTGVLALAGELVATRANAITGIWATTTGAGQYYAYVGGVSDDSDVMIFAFDDGYTGITEFTGKAVLRGTGGNLALCANGATLDIEFYTGGQAAANKHMILDQDGLLGIGVTPIVLLDVADDVVGWMGRFTNDGNNANRQGFYITCGTDAGGGGAIAIGFYDGDVGDCGFIHIENNQVTLDNPSDKILKRDIEDTASVLGRLRQVQIRDFTMRRSGGRLRGFIAQELAAPFSEMVGRDRESGLLYTQPMKMIPVNTKGIQEIDANLNNYILTADAERDAIRVEIVSAKELIGILQNQLALLNRAA